MTLASDRPIATGLPSRRLVGLVLVLTAIRLAVAGATGLVDDEAYYRLWSLPSKNLLPRNNPCPPSPTPKISATS